jgi:guanylate kinase
MLNPKLANAGEVFIMANSREEIKDIHSMNNAQSEGARQQRMSTIQQKGAASDLDFTDVKQNLAIQKNQLGMDSVRRR